VLYPFVPEHKELFASIKKSFEATHPGVAVEMIDLSTNYYDETKPRAITNTEADVLEIDSVFMDDFIAGRIQPLPKSLIPADGTMLPVAASAAQSDGVWYGVPHWACAHYLFFARGDPLGTATTLDDIEREIGANPPHGRGLLADLKGKLTLGELYVQAADEVHSPSTLDPNAVNALKRARILCEPKFCRSAEYHRIDGFYARQFADGGGRALLGYSERLYYVAQESHDIEVDVIPMSLAQRREARLAWVDSLAISKACVDRCLSDAAAFIQFATDRAQVEKGLISSATGLPRYVLPALEFFYTDAGFLARMPLYAKFRRGLDGAVPIRGRKLNATLSAIGRELDEHRLGN
jgi:thiamine pyridinylase